MLTLNKRQQVLFNRRTRNIFAGHKRRAKEAGQTLDYDIGHLRRRFLELLGDNQACPIFKKPLTIRNVSADHARPTSRGGPHSWWNLVYMDIGCNQAKGSMTLTEFQDMLTPLNDAERDNVLRRLRAGNRFYGKK